MVDPYCKSLGLHCESYEYELHVQISKGRNYIIFSKSLSRAHNKKRSPHIINRIKVGSHLNPINMAHILIFKSGHHIVISKGGSRVNNLKKKCGSTLHLLKVGHMIIITKYGPTLQIL